MLITREQIQEARPMAILMTLLAGGRRYVAVRGGVADWACYEGDATDSNEEVALHGHKVYPYGSGKTLLYSIATPEAMELYRM